MPGMSHTSQKKSGSRNVSGRSTEMGEATAVLATLGTLALGLLATAGTIVAPLSLRVIELGGAVAFGAETGVGEPESMLAAACTPSPNPRMPAPTAALVYRLGSARAARLSGARRCCSATTHSPLRRIFTISRTFFIFSPSCDRAPRVFRLFSGYSSH